MLVNTFAMADICLKYQYIVDAEELLHDETWFSKVLQSHFFKTGVLKAKQGLVYAEFKDFVIKLRREVRKAPYVYSPDIITKILLTKREKLILDYPEIFPEPTESLGWYADKQLIKAYLKGDIYSKEYDIQAILDEKVRVRQVLDRERELEKKQREEDRLVELERIKQKELKYESEKIPIEKGMVFNMVRNIKECYFNPYSYIIKEGELETSRNLADYVRYSKIKAGRYIINEVLIEGKVHPEKLVNL